MKKFLIFIIFLSFLSCLKAEQLTINYYHKGTIVHSQQIEQGTAINTLPQLNLSSCDNNINIFVGWIAEEDIKNYQTANTITPTFVTEEYKPTTNINLYALFADKEHPSTEFIWQQVKSIDELKNNDQIIIASHKYDYAIGKKIDNKQHLIAVAITKNDDKSTIIPNDNVQIFTLTETDNSLLWGINNGNGYLSNTVKKEAISTIPEIKTWSSWLFTFDPTTYKVNIRNEYTDCYRYLYFREYDDLYFACREKTIDNLTIYKQKPSYEVNYLACTTPDAVEFTITLHDRDNTSEIKCKNNTSIELPEANSNIDYWNFYGWSTEPITENTTTTPTIITSPYTPTNNINLYAIYQATTTDSLVMNDKVVPASWTVNETIDAFSKISLYHGNYIEIPTTKNITQIDVKMRKLIKTNLNQRLYIATDNDTLESELTTNLHKTYSFNFNHPTTTALKFYPSSLSPEEGLRIDSIVIHQQPQYTSNPIKQEYAVLSFDKNNETNDTLSHYSIKQHKGGNITLPNNAFTHPSKDFLCWNTQIDGSGIEYENQSIVKNITQDMTLYAQWGIRIIVNANETFNSTEQPEIDYLVIKNDINGNTGNIIIDNNNLQVSKNITTEKTIDGSRYYFFSLPFDCPITNIKAIDNQNNLLSYAKDSSTGDYVICYYDQEQAANNANSSTNKAWVEIINPNHILKANQGYIIGYFGNANEKITVKFKSNQNQTITSPQNKTLDFGDNYSWYTEGNNLSSNGWNLIGYPYYKTIQESSLTNFVTIPNNDGKTYTQCTYQEALNSNKITPFCSFFVQLDKNNPPTFTINENISLFSNENIQEKIVINVSNNKYSDYTTIINNNDNTKNYEIGYDLKKWIGYADNPQIYTIENDIPLAFNSQNIDNTTKLSLGIYAPTEDEYTFTSTLNYHDIFLTDKENNITINLSKQKYTIQLKQGIYNDRFEICFKNITSNEINFSQSKINFFIKNGLIYFENIPQNATIYVYNSAGKLINTSNSRYYQLQIKGVYHIVIIKDNIKIDNFDVIY